jgi:hypothetical protein
LLGDPFRSLGLLPFAEPRLLVLPGPAMFEFMLVLSMGRIHKVWTGAREGLNFGRGYKVTCQSLGQFLGS